MPERFKVVLDHARRYTSARLYLFYLYMRHLFAIKLKRYRNYRYFFFYIAEDLTGLRSSIAWHVFMHHRVYMSLESLSGRSVIECEDRRKSRPRNT